MIGVLTNLGNQDRSLSAGAVLPVGILVIEKVAIGGDATFDFATTGSGLAPFSITTSGGSGSKSTILTAGTKTVTESSLPDGWDFTSLICDDAGTTVSGQTATIDLDSGETITCTFTNTKRAPNYTIVKTATVDDGGSSVDEAGDVINYTIVVANTGNTSLTGVSVSDPRITNLAGPVESANSDGVLEVGETWTYTGSYTVLQSDIDDNGGGDGDIDNTATVSSKELGDKSDSEAVGVTQAPAYTIVKTATVDDGGSSVDEADDIINYTIVVANTGNQSLTGVSVSDPRLPGLAGPVESVTTNGVLEVGETWTYTGSYTVLQSDIDDNGGGDGTIDNTATVSSKELGDKSDSEAVDVTQAPAYTIVKTADVSSVGAADNVINYTIVVANTGNQSLTGVSVSDPRLPGLAGPVESVTTNGVLEVGETWTYTGSYTVLQSDIDDNGGGDGTIDNTATVSSKELGDKSDSASVAIDGKPSYTIVKTAALADGGATANTAGDVINYTIVVANTGATNLTGVSVSDPRLTDLTGPVESANGDGVLEVGETWTYTGSYTVLQSDIDDNGGGDGDIDNTATVSSKELGNKSDSEAVGVTQAPAYTIVKTATVDDGGSSVDEADDIINYTIVVANTGNQSLTGVSVSDPRLPGLTGPVESVTTNGVLEVGETWTYTGSYTVLQSDIDDNGGGDGTIDNTATVTSTQIPAPRSSSAAVPLSRKPKLAVDKQYVSNADEDGSGTISLDDSLTYKIIATNTGNQTLTNVTVSDNLTGDNTSCPSVAPGATCELTVVYVVTQSDVDAGVINNVGTADSDQTDPVTDPETVSVPQDPKLAVDKQYVSNADEDGSGTISLDDSLTYKIIATNTGNQTLTNVTVSDNLTGDNTSCLSVAPGATCELTVVYVVTQADVNAGVINNIGTADSNETTPVTDPETVTVPQDPSIAANKVLAGNADEDGSNSVSLGDTLSYTITATNNGNVTLTNVTVDDDLTGTTNAFCAASLAPGQSCDVVVTYMVIQDDVDGGGIFNTGTVEGTTPSQQTVSDSDSEIVDILRSPSIDIIKSGTLNLGGDGEVTAGDIISYSFRVENTGNVTLYDVRINDAKAGVTDCYIGTMVPGEVDDSTCTGSYAINTDDINSGSVLNTATVNAFAPNESQVEDSDTHTEPLALNPSLVLEKTAAPTTYAGVGEVITYTYVVTNNGNVTISGPITVTDDIEGEVVCSASSLAPNLSATCTLTHTITQLDIDNGSLTNVAFATGKAPNGAPVVSPEDQATVQAIQTPALAVDKQYVSNADEDGSGTISLDDSLTYKIIATNTGNQTLTNVTVSDNLTGDNTSCASVAPGATCELTVVYVVTQADVECGRHQQHRHRRQRPDRPGH